MPTANIQGFVTALKQAYYSTLPSTLVIKVTVITVNSFFSVTKSIGFCSWKRAIVLFMTTVTIGLVSLLVYNIYNCKNVLKIDPSSFPSQKQSKQRKLDFTLS